MAAIPYLRRANYYETDQMGVVHHSNYIRWFEEARIDLLKQHGIDYRGLEQRGIIIPVVDVSCIYLRSVRFDDEVEIHLALTRYTGARMCFAYEVRFCRDGKPAAKGSSTHCFISPDGKPLALKRVDKELDIILTSLVCSDQTNA